jgi:hypothetical protein
MSTIDRYQKKGGFLQLLTLVESSGTDKREKFLKVIGDENPAWKNEIVKKMITLERVCSWDSAYLMEILKHVPDKNMAAIISFIPEEQKKIFYAGMTALEKRKIESLVEEHKATAGEFTSSFAKLQTTIRNLTQSGDLKFEKFDPDLAIPENIEDILSTMLLYSISKTEKPEAKVVSAPSISHIEPTPKPQSPPPSPSATSTKKPDELTHLREQVAQLSQENQRLVFENQSLKAKLEMIRKGA